MAEYTIADTGNPSTNGANLQTRIDSVVYGDKILLLPGVEYRYNYIIPYKGAGGSAITIEPTTWASFPFRRVVPSDVSIMPLVTTPNTGYVFYFQERASWWTFHGLNITTVPGLYATADVCNFLVNQQIESRDRAFAPEEIHWDRCYLHPYETGFTPQTSHRTTAYGMTIDGANCSVKRCRLSDFGGLGNYKDNGILPDGNIGSLADVTAATIGAQCRVTLSTTNVIDPGVAAQHKRRMTFKNAPAGWSALNQTFMATYVDATHWDLETFDPVTWARTPFNTSGFSAFTFSAGNTCKVVLDGANSNISILIAIGPGPTVIEDNYVDGFSFPLFLGGSGSSYHHAADLVTVTSTDNPLNQCTLSGLGSLAVGDLVAFQNAQPMAITGITKSASSTVAVAPSPATTGLSLTVASGHGANFPAAPFHATVFAAGDPDNLRIANSPFSPFLNFETVLVTAKAGDVFTITRNYRQGFSRAILVGDNFKTTTKLTVTPHRFPNDMSLGVSDSGVVIQGITPASQWSFLNLGPEKSPPEPNPPTHTMPSVWAGEVVGTTQTEIEIFHTWWYGWPFGPVDTSAITDAWSSSGVTWTYADNYWAQFWDVVYWGDFYRTSWMVGKVTNIAGNVITYDYQGHATQSTGGNGAGVPIKVGSPVRFNGETLHDIEIRRNHFVYQKYWLDLYVVGGYVYSAGGSPPNTQFSNPKGFFEVKYGNDITLDGNIFECVGGSMAPYQTPCAFFFNLTSQKGDAPWLTISNFVARNNICKYMAQISGTLVDEWYSGSTSGGVLIENNLIYDNALVGQTPGACNHINNLADPINATFRHNTYVVPGTGSAAILSLEATRMGVGWVWQDNILVDGTGGYSLPIATWEAANTIGNNYVIDTGRGNIPANRPTTDIYVASLTAMRFQNHTDALTGGNYHGLALAVDSPGHAESSTYPGTDVGVDFALLDAALAGTASEGASASPSLHRRLRGVVP